MGDEEIVVVSKDFICTTQKSRYTEQEMQKLCKTAMTSVSDSRS